MKKNNEVKYVRKDLKKSLKNRHIQLIALGGIIGSSFFLGTGYVISSIGPAAFLAYALGGLIVYMVMLCLGELSVALPTSSSFVSYAAEFVSPAWACGVGWTYWINWVAYIPSECIAGGIIMHHFFPLIPVFFWAVCFGLLVTVINLTNVGAFGELEFWLAIIKIAAILFFIAAAVLIFIGIFPIHGAHHIIGAKYITGDGGFFPKGKLIIFTSMVMLLVNYQGSEIIGLASAESQNPAESIPKAVKNVSFRIIAIFLIPIFLLVLIFPWNIANLSQSVFSDALSFYGMRWVSGIFTLVVLSAALSCANSGMYGTVRALYGLAKEGMAPRSLKMLNKNSVPQNAIIVTILAIWIFLIISYFFSASSIFAALLSISGFTGGICWISICWSQYNFRKRLHQNGYSANDLTFKIKGFPYITFCAIWVQVGCLVFVLFNPELRIACYFGIPALVIPILIAHFKKFKVPTERRTVSFAKTFPNRKI
ncbi:MAG: amino acid permease [Fusobacteria bacterium]|nr:amino acid permease [Fusobacteriota bacterium]